MKQQKNSLFGVESKGLQALKCVKHPVLVQCSGLER